MRVTFARETHLDAIFADPTFVDLIELVHTHEVARRLVTSLLKVFRAQPRPDGIARYARHWARSNVASPAEIEWVGEEVGPRMNELYARHDPGQLRGAIVERLVYSQIESRYRHDSLEDNVRIQLANGVAYTSSTSVDVAGWDGNVGECHDCRARSARLNIVWIRELEQGLPPQYFRIGVVTIDSRVQMSADLRQVGYSPAAQTTLIPLEELWDLAPLQPRV